MKALKYKVETLAPRRRLYTFQGRNRRGEEIAAEITACENSGGPHSLPQLWKKADYIDRELKSYLSVTVYATDERGECWGRYNPQEKINEGGRQHVIDFGWMFEATPENEQKLLDEIARRAFA